MFSHGINVALLGKTLRGNDLLLPRNVDGV
jgi:hypothetical protein